MTISITPSGFVNFQNFGFPQTTTKKEHPFLTASLPYQLPSFIREDYPKFMAFLQAYYEWMEQKGGIVSDTKRIITNQDIDTTDLDEYFEFFRKEFLVDISSSILAPKDLVLKNIKDYYRARGTEKSFKFFLRILLGQEAKFYYPRVDMLKLSDGKWIQSKTIRAVPDTGNIFSLVGKKIRGCISNASAYVESIIQIQEGPYTVYELYLNSSSISGIFSAGELFKDDIDSAIMARISTVPVSVSVTTKGSGYQVGQTVTISGSGYGATAKVSSVNLTGGIEKISIINFGAEYITGTTTVSIPSPISGEQAQATIILGAVIQYPGFYLNEDGQLSTTKYLQDSYYYQQFSYVVIVEEALATYKDVLKKALHPAGLILFATALSYNTVDGSSSIGIGKDSNQSLIKRTVQQFSNPKIDGQQLSLNGERHTTIELEYDEKLVGEIQGLKAWYNPSFGVLTDSDNKVTLFNDIVNDNRENRFLYSENLTNAYWTTVSATVSDNQVTNPINGALTASKLTASGGVTTHYIYTSFDPTTERQRHSIYAKIGSATTGIVLAYQNQYQYTFDLAGGVPTLNFNSTGNAISATQVLVSSDGWYRCTVEFRATTGGASAHRVYLTKAGSTSFDGSSSDYVYIYGNQHQKFSANPVYYPTTSSAKISGDYGAIQETAANRPYLSRSDTKENICYNSQPDSSGDVSTGAVLNVTFAAPALMSDWNNLFTTVVVVGDNSVSRNIYFSRFTSSSVTYDLSMYVRMDDGTAPTFTGTRDFYLVINGGASAAAITTTSLGNGLYRISRQYVGGNAVQNVGFLKDASCSTKTFKVQGFQLRESSTSSAYLATTTYPQYSGINGNQSLVFDGINDLLISKGLGSAFAGSDLPMTVVSAIKLFNNSGTQSIIDFTRNSDGFPIHGFRTNSGILETQRRDDALTLITRTGSGTIGTSTNIVSSVFTGTNVNMYLNGVLNGSASQSLDLTTASFDQAIIGARLVTSTTVSQPLNGYICEILIFNSVLSDTDRKIAETYLMKKYISTKENITVNSNINKKLQSIKVNTSPVLPYKPFSISDL